MLISSILLASASSIPQTSWIITYGNSIFITASGIAIKDMYDRYNRSRDIIIERERVERRIRGDSFEIFDLSTLEYIENEKMVSSFIDILESNVFGVIVVGAPNGAGKSTSLNMAVRKFKEKKQNSNIFYTTALTPGLFRESLGIPKDHLIRDYIPRNSFIFIDQIDLNELTDINKNFLVDLATSSVNSKKFIVIICVSNSEIFSNILKLNGSQKIIAAFPPSMFKWDEDRLRMFLKSQKPDLSEDKFEQLLALIRPSFNPGSVMRVLADSRIKRGEIDESVPFITKLVNDKVNQWELFQNVPDLGYIIDDNTYK